MKERYSDSCRENVSLKKEKKRLLIFAHYYYPDVASTGQILRDLAEGMTDSFDVTVICVVPSYTGLIEEKYKTKKYYFETLNKVKIIRVRVPEFTKTYKGSRIKNIVTYFFRALVAVRKSGSQEYIFTISQPPILGGLLGVIGKWMKHGKMIYCIQDFNPEQIMTVGYSRNRLLLNVLMLIDKFSCKRSDMVITVGRDMVETLKHRFAGKRVPKHVMINNWIDERKIYPLKSTDYKVMKFKKKYNLVDKFVFMYSGNIGLYYGLENLLEVIRTFEPGTKAADGREVVFAFVGAGVLLDKLKDYVAKYHMHNVLFIPYQDKEELICSLNAADVHWCVSAKGIRGISCPSKFYGCVSVAKPILAVLEEGSEVYLLIKETECGLVCEPGDYETVKDNIKWFLEQAGTERMENMGKKGRIYLENNMTKRISIDKYIKAIDAI